jgi:hypothetical protein
LVVQWFVPAEHLEIIRQLAFRVAKTMPETPHQYTTRKPYNPALEAAYVALHGFIEASDVRELYKGRRKHYLCGDGLKYWHMGALFAHGNVWSRIINRMKIKDDLERLRLEDPPAAEAAERHLADHG